MKNLRLGKRLPLKLDGLTMKSFSWKGDIHKGTYVPDCIDASDWFLKDVVGKTYTKGTIDLSVGAFIGFPKQNDVREIMDRVDWGFLQCFFVQQPHHEVGLIIMAYEINK